MSKYFISSSADIKFHSVSAKTLTAAKVAASKTYQVSVGGRLEVLEDMGNGRLEVVAIKYGYDNWVNA